RTAIADDSSEAHRFREAMQEVKGQTDESYRFIEAYRQAEAAENRAVTAEVRRNFARSAQYYQEATQLYRQSIDRRKQQIEGIHTLLENYRQALEQEDLERLKSYQIGRFREEFEATWSRFFRAVSNLRVTMNARSLTFRSGGVRAEVEVQMHYSGAQGGNTPNTWHIELVESAAGIWRVAHH
ncbi:MAG: hypothetical protein D6681_05655, partial [Calditrichaeota bacterium]